MPRPPKHSDLLCQISCLPWPTRLSNRSSLTRSKLRSLGASSIRPCIKQRDYLVCRSHVTEDDGNSGERGVVLFIRSGGIGIRDHYALVVHHHAVAQRALTTHVCGGAHDDECVDPSLPQDLIEAR